MPSRRHHARAASQAVVTSATVDDVDRLDEYLGGAPVRRVPGRHDPCGARTRHEQQRSATSGPRSRQRTAPRDRVSAQRSSRGRGGPRRRRDRANAGHRAENLVEQGGRSRWKKTRRRGFAPVRRCLPSENALAFAPGPLAGHRVARRRHECRRARAWRFPRIAFVVDTRDGERMVCRRSSGVDRLVVGAISLFRSRGRAARGELARRARRLYTKDALGAVARRALAAEIMRANLASARVVLAAFERELGPGVEGRDRAGATERAVAHRRCRPRPIAAMISSRVSLVDRRLGFRLVRPTGSARVGIRAPTASTSSARSTRAGRRRRRVARWRGFPRSRGSRGRWSRRGGGGASAIVAAIAGMLGVGAYTLGE